MPHLKRLLCLVVVLLRCIKQYNIIYMIDFCYKAFELFLKHADVFLNEYTWTKYSQVKRWSEPQLSPFMRDICRYQFRPKSLNMLSVEIPVLI